jgi:uncharacterized membrane protein
MNLIRVVTGRPRLFLALLAGVAAFPFVPYALQLRTRLICAWDVTVIVYLLLAAQLFISERQSRMADDAAAQQEGEWTIFAITVAVVVFSFVAIFGEFAAAKDAAAEAKSWRVALVALTLLASWLMTHTTFCLRYAHEFYSQSPGAPQIDGGLQFPGETAPDYLDFAYFSLVLGMTFQVSDVQITSRKLRRLAALHGLLSFLFNTVIVALTVNIAAGLL